MNLVEHLHGLTRDDPGRVLRAHEEFARLRTERGLDLEGRGYAVALEPVVVERALVDDARHGLEGLHAVLEHVGDAYRLDPQVRGFIDTYEAAERWLLVEPPVRPYISICRYDGMFIDGVYRVVEVNTCCPGSVLKVPTQYPLWQSVIRDVIEADVPDPGPQPFIHTPDLFLRTLLTTHHRQFGRDPKAALIATLNGLYYNEVDLMVRGLQALGVEARSADLLQAAPQNDGSLRLDGHPVDLVYHKLDQLQLVGLPGCVPYLDASTEHRFSFLCSLMAQCVLEDGATLALLSDPTFSYLFSDDQRRLIDKHVPWTRVVEPVRTPGPEGETIHLADYVLSNRARLVIKPRGLTRGEGVLVGPSTPQKVWDDAVAKALGSRGYIVQDYVPLPRRDFLLPGTAEIGEMWYEMDPYLFDGKFAGFQCRASLDPVVNVAQNGMMVPVVVSDGPS